jgi:hypothetical protein
MLGYESYDNALPQDFFEEASAGMDEHPSTQFVWVYRDKKDSYLFGLPGPITSKARDWLKEPWSQKRRGE